MVEHQPSKLDTWVRFPSPAFTEGTLVLRFLFLILIYLKVLERRIEKEIYFATNILADEILPKYYLDFRAYKMIPLAKNDLKGLKKCKKCTKNGKIKW